MSNVQTFNKFNCLNYILEKAGLKLFSVLFTSGIILFLIELFSIASAQAITFYTLRVFSKNENGFSTQYCLDVPNGKAQTGTPVILWQTCHGADNQLWAIGTDRTVRPKGNLNQCLDVPNYNFNSGTGITLWDCKLPTIGWGEYNQNQQWYYYSSGELVTYSTNGGKARCLDAPAPGGKTKNGSQVIIWDCHKEKNQVWDFYNTNGKLVYTPQKENFPNNKIAVGYSRSIAQNITLLSNQIDSLYVNDLTDFPNQLELDEDAVSFGIETFDKADPERVPEPSFTWSLLAISIGALTFKHKRQNKTVKLSNVN